MRQDLLDREGNPWDFLVSDHFLILNYDFIGTCTYYSTTVCARSMKAHNICIAMMDTVKISTFDREGGLIHEGDIIP